MDRIDKIIKKNKNLSYAKLADMCGLSVHVIKKRYAALGLPAKRIKNQGDAQEQKSSEAAPEEIVQQDIKLHELKKKQGTTDKKYRILLDRIAQVEKERDAILHLNDTIDIYPIKPLLPKKVSEATMFLLASDWHVAERVKSSTINGLNNFTLDIAKKRSERFFKKGLRLMKLFQQDVEINTVVLALIGDFISGNIHDELMEGNQLGPIEEAIFAQNLISSGIKFLLLDKSIKKLIIPCNMGNHSRITKGRRIATENANSLEYFMYYQLKNYFAKEKRVEFIISDGYHTYLDVYGNTIRFHHGHHIRYAGGVGGITIPVNKAIAQWDKIRQVEVDVFGHFHQTQDGGKFISNGSLIGYNAYALSIKASIEPPQQTCFIWDKRRGKTFVAPIFLDSDNW